MSLLVADASDVILNGTAADHDGAVCHPLAYWGRFCTRIHHGRIHRSRRKQPTKAPQEDCTTA